ncbi:hypothetical protein [Undibacterium oligocarboniphilum]|uniref:Uncharacterized protein n=1 Tax=Undibacterium oligocarboniphilum TaxID=666702 RepID=A0A850QFE0_9BURK|nr:hypothetical protein [Undibacterium oligocarboniphilum]MBC3870037.1 hypothetical protein [Undibacterium oligocarboniphilum]NVO78028.1 hypothetical protein [Undibacterium oligocarboniphilum]
MLLLNNELPLQFGTPLLISSILQDTAYLFLRQIKFKKIRLELRIVCAISVFFVRLTNFLPAARWEQNAVMRTIGAVPAAIAENRAAAAFFVR